MQQRRCHTASVFATNFWKRMSCWIHRVLSSASQHGSKKIMLQSEARQCAPRPCIACSMLPWSVLGSHLPCKSVSEPIRRGWEARMSSVSEVVTLSIIIKAPLSALYIACQIEGHLRTGLYKVLPEPAPPSHPTLLRPATSIPTRRP